MPRKETHWLHVRVEKEWPAQLEPVRRQLGERSVSSLVRGLLLRFLLMSPEQRRVFWDGGPS